MRIQKNFTGFWGALPCLCLVLLLGPALISGCGGGSDDLQFPTQYQAVFMDNGQVFFGRLGKSGDSFLTLRDVFYIQRQVDKEKKDAKNLLLKRGSEWHGPDFMRINKQHVVLIEPVTPDSRVAQLIWQAKRPPAPKPQEKKPAPPAGK